MATAKAQAPQPGLEAETAVIGALLIDPRILKDVIFTVREQDFGVELNRKIFRAARELYLRAKPVTPVTIRDKVGKESSEYLAQLLEITTTSANWREYAAIMAGQASMRRMQDIGMQLAAATTPEECSALAAKLQQEQSGGRQLKAYDMTDLQTSFHARQTDKNPPRYVKTGIAGVDDLSYIQRGDVIVIGGRPSDGKTLLALQMAAHMAREWSVGFFSCETDWEKISDRMVSALADISFGAIKQHELQEADWTRFAEWGVEAERLKFKLIEASGMSAGDVIAISRACKFDVIFVDYVQLLRPENQRAMRSEQVAEISRALHTFAQQPDKTLVVELAQLSRPERPQIPARKKRDAQSGKTVAEKSFYREASMFDLKESGQLEQDADMILILSRPDPEDGYDPKKQRRLRIEKNKEGRTGYTMLYLDGDKQTFIPMADETAKDRDYERKIMERNARNDRMSGAKRR